MADRLRWWLIPAALLVMARVVTLGEPAIDVPPPAVPATGKLQQKQVHEATAPRLHLRSDQLDTAAERAFFVAVPADFAGLRAKVTLWRRTANGREGTPWLVFAATVRDDGTVPISGLAAGHYDVAVQLPTAAEETTFAIDDAVAPGRADLTAAAPLR